MYKVGGAHHITPLLLSAWHCGRCEVLPRLASQMPRKASPVRAALFPQDRVTQEFVETYFRSRSSLTSPAWIGISRGTSNQAYKFIDGTNVAQVRADVAPAHGCC